MVKERWNKKNSGRLGVETGFDMCILSTSLYNFFKNGSIVPEVGHLLYIIKKMFKRLSGTLAGDIRPPYLNLI